MLTAACLLVLVGSGVIWAWLAGFLICREIAISGLRLVALQNGISLKVDLSAKFKTLSMDVAIVCLLVNRPLFSWPFIEVGFISLWITVALSIYSAVKYFREYLSKCLENPKHSLIIRGFVLSFCVG